MNKKMQPKAPRFHSLFERREKSNILFIARQTLEDHVYVAIFSSISLSKSQFQLFPMSRLEENTNVRAATLHRTAEEYILTIYRYDPKDPEDERINVDEYIAWVGLPTSLPRDEMIKHGSTDYDANFQDYEKNFVYFKKKKRVKNHHIKELPENVRPFSN